MKFSVSSNELLSGLSAVSGVVPTKATLPILETILFESEDNRLKLTGTDLEISAIEYIDIDIEIDGAVAIPARRLLETLRQLPNIPVHFTVDEEYHVEFKTDKGTYKLVGENPDDFPEVADLEDAISIDTQSEVLLRAINKTSFAVSNDDLRPAMMGVYFQIGTEESKFAATDGHRLVRYERTDLTADSPIDFIVPEKALSILQKSFETGECNVLVDEEHALFKNNNTIIITRLINEKYPNYESVIPRDNEKEMIVERDQMLSTVKRVSIFSSSSSRQIRLQISSSELTIRAEDLNMSSEANESISCEYSDEDLEIGFNARYLADVLGNVDSDSVRFEFSTPNRAGIVIPQDQDENEDILMLVMPVMLNNES